MFTFEAPDVTPSYRVCRVYDRDKFHAKAYITHSEAWQRGSLRPGTSNPTVTAAGATVDGCLHSAARQQPQCPDQPTQSVFSIQQRKARRKSRRAPLGCAYLSLTLAA